MKQVGRGSFLFFFAVRDCMSLNLLPSAGFAAPSAATLVWQLPLAMILQYLCVGLHGTACDQLFTSFLVAPIASGGLGLTADHYALLVAIMFFFSMVWQFKFYPTVGPPNGPLSHLSM